jgi:hypothetical protein
MAIGVFGLQVAYRLKRLEVMSTQNTHGWFGGGNAAPLYSTVDRIDFSNDTGTANIRGLLSSSRTQSAATGNSNYGWFGGGVFPTPASWYKTIDRVDFSNDSVAASFRGTLLSQYKAQVAATGNSNYGWFGGGNTNAPAPTSIVERLDFSNDSALASLRAPLSVNRAASGATGNSNYGWFGGGGDPASPTPNISASIDRIDFSNDYTAVSPRGTFTLVKSFCGATGNSNYGWWGGGVIGGSRTSYIERIDFSNDLATGSVRGGLPISTDSITASGNADYGWFCGGGIPAYVSTINRINFSNDLVSASPRGPLSAVKGYGAATSGQAKGPAIKLQKAGSYGWFGGGLFVNSTSPLITSGLATVDRIDFSNDLATASPRGQLSAARGYLAATGNSNYGWFSGGGSFVATVERIDFSNDSVPVSVRGPLITGRTVHAGTANSNYGWFGGGGVGGGRSSTVNRINFSNDLSTTSARGLLSEARSALAATGNSNYGWFGGGVDPANTPAYVSTIDRIDFSNDSTSASPRGPLSAGRGYFSATGNSNYGWFGGGFSGSHTATVDRINFSNDLNASASVRSPLDAVISHTAAAGNSNYGWWTGGASGGFARVNVVRINFSNDLTTISTRGPLNGARYRHAGTSNSTR